MLPKAHRLTRKDLEQLFKEPDTKVFSEYGTLFLRTSTSLKVAPIIPRKLRLGSVKMHRLRRVIYHCFRDLLSAESMQDLSPKTQDQGPKTQDQRPKPQDPRPNLGHLAFIPKPSFLPLSFEEKKEALKALIQKLPTAS